MTWKEYLENKYFDTKSAISFSGPTKIHWYLKNRGYKVGVHKIRRWLQDQDAYSLQRPLRHKFKRRRVISQGIDYLWDVDLADVTNLQKYNPDIKYLLIAIDTFSRYLWVEPLADKKSKTVKNGFQRIFSKGRKPKQLRADHGREFDNRLLKQYLESEDVGIYFTFNETKANYAERAIRTLKTVMYRYFTHNQSYKYDDKLQYFVNNYNNRPHSSLNEKAPVEITKRNENIIWKHLYIDTLKPNKVLKSSHKVVKRFKYKRGDLVRLSHLKKVFDRDYQEKWTEEIFKVKSRELRQGIPVYKVVDYEGDPVKGTFNEPELQRVRKDADNLFRVEKVLRKRKRNGRREVYVKWLGWPMKFNSWILEADLVDI